MIASPLPASVRWGMWQAHLRKLLTKKLEEAKAKNPSFSLRAFASKLGMSPGALSEILNERRLITLKNAKRIIDNLGLTVTERNRIDGLLKGSKLGDRVLLEDEVFELLGDWKYFALLSLMELSAPPETAGQFAERLNITDKQAKDCLEKLVSLDLAIREGQRYTHSGRHFTTTDEIPSRAIRASHLQDLEKMRDAVLHLPVDERDFTSITFAGSSAELLRAKKMIRRFRDRLSQQMSAKRKDGVFRLSIGLFPLSRKE